MPDLKFAKSSPFLQVAVFRLRDTCAFIQEDMAGFYRTAALAKVNGIEHVFRWFRKRSVKIALVSDFNRQDTNTILERLDWSIAPLAEASNQSTSLIDLVVLTNSSSKQHNPIHRIQELLDIEGHQMVTIADTPQMLNWSWAAGSLLNIGVTYGQSNYQALAPQPHHGLLDNSLQIPNFILEHLMNTEEDSANTPKVSDYQQLLRLRLPFRFLVSRSSI